MSNCKLQKMVVKKIIIKKKETRVLSKNQFLHVGMSHTESFNDTFFAYCIRILIFTKNVKMFNIITMHALLISIINNCKLKSILSGETVKTLLKTNPENKFVLVRLHVRVQYLTVFFLLNSCKQI